MDVGEDSTTASVGAETHRKCSNDVRIRHTNITQREIARGGQNDRCRVRTGGLRSVPSSSPKQSSSEPRLITVTSLANPATFGMVFIIGSDNSSSDRPGSIRSVLGRFVLSATDILRFAELPFASDVCALCFLAFLASREIHLTSEPRQKSVSSICQW